MTDPARGGSVAAPRRTFWGGPSVEYVCETCGNRRFVPRGWGVPLCTSLGRDSHGAMAQVATHEVDHA